MPITIPDLPANIDALFDAAWNFSPRRSANQRGMWQCALFRKAYNGNHAYAAFKEVGDTPEEAMSKAISKFISSRGSS